MIRYCFLCVLLLTSFSCKQEEVPYYDRLTPEEQDEIRLRASQRCLTDGASEYADLQEKSNEELADLKRGDHWKITIDGVTDPDFLYVWKVTGTTVFFLYQQKSGSTTLHHFIKMTPAFNGSMYDNLLVQKCAKTYKISESSSTVTIKRDDIASTSGSTRYRTDYTYTLSSSYPAYFAIFPQKRVRETLDDDNDVTDTKTFTDKVAYQGDDADLLNDYDDYSDRRYCVVTYTNGAPKTFVFPYTLTCTTDGTNPNTAGDATMDFTQADL